MKGTANMATEKTGYILKEFLLLRLFFILYLTIIGLNPASVSAEQKPLVFSTFEGFEVDKCASIWLIKKSIDQNAIIKFYKRGETPTGGILFDTPNAKFRRYYNMSTYESLLQHYKINDSKLKYIGRIIHDIEVNTWEKKKLKETQKVQGDVNKIIWETSGKKELIEKSNRYFDLLYESF